MINVVIKFSFGQGMQMEIKMRAVPRIGEEILLADFVKTVTRVQYDLEGERVIVITN